MDLGRLDDARLSEPLLAVLADVAEPSDVRLDAMDQLGGARLAPDERVGVAEAIMRVLSDDADDGLRQHGVLVLGELVDVHGVVDALGALAMDADESLELRYGAFTSLQRAGLTPQCLGALWALSSDETFGRSTRAALARWDKP